MIKLTSIQFFVEVPNNLNKDKEEAARAIAIGSIQGSNALKLMGGHTINVEHDDEDGENTYYIVTLSPEII